MAEKRENSVLFSLRELRQIEEDRIKEEEHAAQQAEEEIRRRQMEEERRRREEEEARTRAREEEERRRRDEEARRSREEQLRVQETEARARVEAQARLEQERLAQEMEIRRVEAAKKRPTGLIVVSTLMVLVVGGLAFVAYRQKQEKDAEARTLAAEKAMLQQEIEKKLGDIEKLQAEKDAQFQNLLAAKTEADKEAATRALRDKEAQLRSQKEALRKLREADRARAAEDRERKKKVDVKCDPNDPLCGI